MYNIVKRSFDLVFSTIVLCLISPILLVIAIVIKVSSEGPVFHISERVGKNGKVFKMYKFRSMHLKQPGAVESRYLVNAQRIFPFGAFLRKSKMDELPQLINIVLGHMSFVGPRPYPKSVVERLYTSEKRKIISVRPGLACLDSLYDYCHGDLFVTDAEYYKDNIIPVRTELARMYVERKTIALDIYCIYRTILLIFQIVIMKKKEFEYTKLENLAQEKVSSLSAPDNCNVIAEM